MRYHVLMYIHALVQNPETKFKIYICFISIFWFQVKNVNNEAHLGLERTISFPCSFCLRFLNFKHSDWSREKMSTYVLIGLERNQLFIIVK